MQLLSYILIAYVIFSSPAGAEKKGPQDLLNSIKRGAASVGVKRRGDAFNPRLKVPQPQIDKKVGSDNKNSESSIDPESNKKNKAEDTGTTTNGKSSSPPNQLITTNENSQAGAQKTEPDPERKLPIPISGNLPSGGSEGVSFRLWWPVCVFVDGPNANAQITEMVQMSAACGVNLQPYPRVVTNSFGAENDSGINNGQRSSCNLSEAGIASKGSTLFLTNKSSTVADRMCGQFTTDSQTQKEVPTTTVAGCNELANGSGTDKQREDWKANGKADKKGDGWGGVAGGSVAVGIVDKEGYTEGNVYSHEAMGHGQMGWPNGKTAGNGIGDPADEKKGIPNTEGDLGAYTGKGCARMRASAIPDPEEKHKYYASKTKYYNHESMSKKPLALGEPIWKKFTGGPSLANVPKKRNPAARGDEDGSDLIGRAGPGHKKNRRLTLRNSGKPVTGSTITQNTKNGSGTRGEDSLAEAGSQVRGGAGGNPTDNDTIGFDRSKSLLADKPNGESSEAPQSFDPQFFNTFNTEKSPSNSIASTLNQNSESKTLRNPATSNSELDPEFFKMKEESSALEKKKLFRRSLPVEVASVPAARQNPEGPKNLNGSRGLRTQVPFE